MPNILQESQAANLPVIQRISALIEDGRARLKASGQSDATNIVEVAGRSIGELEAMLVELEAHQRTVRGVAAQDGARWEAGAFEQIGFRLSESPRKCLYFAQWLLRELTRFQPSFWRAPRVWWRVSVFMRRLRDLTAGYEKLAEVAQSWPKVDEARVAEARASIAAGHSVELKDVLRELHAQN